MINAKTPSLFKRLWRAWKRFGRRLGNFQSRLILSLFYFTAFCPFALLVRWFADPLAIKSKSPKGWRPIDGSRKITLETASRQSS